MLARAGLLRASFVPPAKHFVLREIMMHIEALEATITQFEDQLLLGLEPEHNVRQLLQTIAGVDRIGAATLIVEIGTDMNTFGRADRLTFWVGVCPGNHESAGKRQSGKIRKGNECSNPTTSI